MSAIEALIEGHSRDLGDGFVVRRVLPAADRVMIGPFIFFDHMGPTSFKPGPAINVRPHPHTALATVTYLFEGAIMHRDSLGYAQEIHPGDVNWMIAGRGIVHSERTTPRSMLEGMRLDGIQSWVALPDGHEDDPPQFAHHPRDTLPYVDADGVKMRVIAGEAFFLQSPVDVRWPTLYVDVHMAAGSTLTLDAAHEERAIYVAAGRVIVSGEAVDPAQLAVLRPAALAQVVATESARLILLGGAKFSTPRLISWNFVASNAEHLEKARTDWRQRNRARFPDVPGDDKEFIPLP